MKRLVAGSIIWLTLGPAASAAEFAISASPPRFELAATAGSTVRQVVELENVTSVAAGYSFETADWTLSPTAEAAFTATLSPGSCRPWVSLERRSVMLPPAARYRFRFEVAVPPATPPSECRFAIMVSGQEQRVTPGQAASFPIVGQIGIIVYVAVGGAKPAVEVVAAAVEPRGGVATPVIIVRNSGTAHGRLGGVLRSIDAAGVRRTFVPTALPIMAGETRTIALTIDHGDESGNRLRLDAARPEAPRPVTDRPAEPGIRFPLMVKGTLNDGVQSFPFTGTFSP